MLATVRHSKELSLMKKEQLNRETNEKSLVTLCKCKAYGLSIKSDGIHLMESLTEKHLLSEVAYLKMTVPPYINKG